MRVLYIDILEYWEAENLGDLLIGLLREEEKIGRLSMDLVLFSGWLLPLPNVEQPMQCCPTKVCKGWDRYLDSLVAGTFRMDAEIGFNFTLAALWNRALLE